MSLLIAVGATGCNKTDDPASLVAQARQYQEKGDAKAAVIQLKNALQKNPDDPEARFMLGAIYLQTGDAASAEIELRRAAALGVESDRVTPLLAKSLIAQGAAQKVLDETASEKGVTATPEILAMRGNAYFSMSKLDLSREAFQKALDGKPDYISALVGLGKNAALRGDTVSAAHYADLAIEKNPREVEGWQFRGDFLRSKANNAGAIKAYDEALKLQPKDVNLLNSRANAHLAAGEIDLAKADIAAGKVIAQNNLNLVYTQALLDHTQGNDKAALEGLQTILRVAPDHMPTILLSGAVQLALGNMEQAEQALKKYLSVTPDNGYARKMLASVYMKSGQNDKAKTLVTAALKDAPQDPQLLMMAGESYLQDKQFAKATELFKKADAIAPGTSIVHTALGMSKLGEGDSTAAVAELERATAIDTKAPNAGVLLVMTQLRLKQFDKALAAVNAMEKQKPNDPLVHNLKGGVYLGMKDTTAARASFEKSVSLAPTYFPAIENLARLDIQEKHPEAAKKRFEALLEIDKKSISAMTALAVIAQANGQPQEATSWLEKAVAANPGVVAPSIELGRHYLKTGAKDRAAALAQKLFAANDSNPDVIDLLGQTQALSNDLPGAAESFKKLVTLKPNSAPALLRLASIQVAMQKQAEAMETLNRALTLQPDSLEAQAVLYTLKGRSGDFESALKISRQVQVQRPKEPIGSAMEGDVLMAQKKFALAQKAYEQAFALSRNEQIAIKLHNATASGGREKDADSRLLQYLADTPTSVAGRVYLGNRYLARKQPKAAIEQFEAALKTAPQNAALLNNLAYAYQTVKDPRAVETAEKAFKLAPTNPGIMDTLGWVLVEKGEDIRGLDLLRKASSQAPTNEEIRFHLAMGLIKSGDKPNARKELEQLAASKTFSRADEAREMLKSL